MTRLKNANIWLNQELKNRILSDYEFPAIWVLESHGHIGNYGSFQIQELKIDVSHILNNYSASPLSYMQKKIIDYIMESIENNIEMSNDLLFIYRKSYTVKGKYIVVKYDIIEKMEES